MKAIYRKVLAMLLAMVMLVSMVPVSAFADEAEFEAVEAEEAEEYSEAEEEYTEEPEEEYIEVPEEEMPGLTFAEPAGSITISDVSEAVVGSEITVKVNVCENLGLSMLQFGVKFDNKKLTLLETADGELLKEKSTPNPNGENTDPSVDKIYFVWETAKAENFINDEGSVFEMTFKVNEVEPCTTYISFINEYDFIAADTNYQEIELLAVNGTVTIVPKERKYHAAVPATCTKDGNIEYWEDPDTHVYYTTATGFVEVESIVDPAKGHTEVIDPAVEASCTKTGLTEGKHCSVCNTVLAAQSVIPMTSHTEVIDEKVEPTCTETGLTEGSHCSVCGGVITEQEEVPATGHRYSTGWDMNEENHWHVPMCGDTTEPADMGEHVWSSEIIVNPTHKAEGAIQYTCTVCDKWRTDSIEKLPEHTYDIENPEEFYKKSDATCTEPAEYFYACECGDITDSETYKYGEPLGHDYADGFCTRCGVYDGVTAAEGTLPSGAAWSYDPATGRLDVDGGDITPAADDPWFEVIKSAGTIVIGESVKEIADNVFADTSIGRVIYTGDKYVWNTEVNKGTGNDILDYAEFAAPYIRIMREIDGVDYEVPAVINIDYLADKNTEFKLCAETGNYYGHIEWTSSDENIACIMNTYNYYGDTIAAVIKGVGEVTITAKTNDALDTMASFTAIITFNGKEYEISRIELTKDGEPVEGSLTVDDTAEITAYFADDAAAATDELEYKVMPADIIEIEDGIVTAKKIGTATIIASLKDDPMNRSVSISVNVVAKGADAAAIAIVDEDGTVHAESEELLNVNSAAVQTFEIIPVNAEGEALPAAKYTFTSSDAKVAKVAKDKYGAIIVTIPKNASGAATITATPVDKTLKSATVSLAVYVRDYAPRLGTTKFTMNTYKAVCAETTLVESYGNEITDVIVHDKVGKTVNTEASDKFAAFVEGGKLYIYSVVPGYVISKNATYNVQLEFVGSITDIDNARIDATVAVKNVLPSVTIKQTVKRNSFLKQSEAVFSVTSKTDIIEAVYVNGGTENLYENGLVTITDNASSAKLKVVFKDYVEAQKNVDKTVSVAAAKVKPNLAIAGSASVNYNLIAPPSLYFVVYNKTNNELVQPDEVTTKSDCFVDCYDQFITVAPSAAMLSVTRKTAFKIVVNIKDNNWTEAIPVTYTVNVIPDNIAPTVKFESNTLTLNIKHPEITADTYATVSEENLHIEGMEFTCAKAAGKIAVSCDEYGHIIAEIIDPSIAAGSYVFAANKLTVGCYTDEAIEKTYDCNAKITVKVINAVPTATAVLDSGKLDTALRSAGYIRYRFNLKNATSAYADSIEIVPALKLGASDIPGEDKFVSLDEDGAYLAGSINNVKQYYGIMLKADEDYVIGKNYKFRFKLVVDGEEIYTPDITVKLTQSAIKVVAEQAAQTVYQSQDKSKVVEFNLDLTGPVGARIGKIDIGTSLNTLFRKSLADAASSITWSIAGNGQSAVVRVEIKDTSKLVAGKTYTLPLEISPEGAAEKGAVTKINVTLKVAK